MISHRTRIFGALLGFAALLLSRYLADRLGLSGEEADELALAITGAIATAVLGDLAAVEARRRKPGVPALPDDVQEGE